MANVTKPIILDETGQAILEELQNLVATRNNIGTTTTDPGEGASLETNHLLIVIEE